MFIPSLDVTDPSQSALKATIGYLGSVILENADIDTIKSLIQETGSTLYWAKADNVDQAVQLWDAGVYKVIFSVDTYSTAIANNDLNGIPEERIAVNGSLNSLSHLTQQQQPSSFILEAPVGDALTTEAVHQFAKTVRGQLLADGGERRVIVNGGSESLVTLDAIAKLNVVNLDVVVSAVHLTAQEEEQGKINVGQAYLASAKTDRADGLFTTMVVDERNTALGLVYSSVKSVAESLKTGQGVYQSRNRGLWYKGATSGATQSLVRIDYDCDGDALRFIVKQHGAGKYIHIYILFKG